MNSQQQIQSFGSSNNMMDSMKSNMMTMLMMNSMNGTKEGVGKGSSGSNMFYMVYIFIATQFVDLIIKYIPPVINHFTNKYKKRFEILESKIMNSATDITDNKVKKKTASITVTINIEDHENVLGLALLDHITNNKNATHVSYTKRNYILNQKDVISLDHDTFCRMTSNIDKDEKASTATNDKTDHIVQVIEIYSFTKTLDELREFLETLKRNYSVVIKNKLGKNRFYFNLHPIICPLTGENKKDYARLPNTFSFVMKPFQTNRRFSNLFGEDIDIIRNRVNFFCKNRKWYDEKGVPYTLGLLISGSPGTGKTSTIKCLANETNRHICNINLNNDITKTQLENLFFNENISVLNIATGQSESYCIPLDQRIYVLEDIDCQSDIVMDRTLKSDIKGDSMDDKYKVDLSFLLNLLDGVLENPGRIVIMTSNFPEVLDNALIRPGRIDVIAKFRKCSNNTIVKMINFFYDIVLNKEEISTIHLLTPEVVTPAEMSQIMFTNFSEYTKTIEELVVYESSMKQRLLNVRDDIDIQTDVHTESNVLIQENAINNERCDGEAVIKNAKRFDGEAFMKEYSLKFGEKPCVTENNIFTKQISAYLPNSIDNGYSPY